MIDLEEYEIKMEKSVEVLRKEFNGLRTGGHLFLYLILYLLKRMEVRYPFKSSI